MSKLSLQLQKDSLKEMAARKPYMKNLAGFEYFVLPRVYKGAVDTKLFCESLPVKKGDEVWDIGTGTGLIALQAKKKGASYVLATDLNPEAVKNANKNSKHLDLTIDVKKADLFGNIRKRFDIISFNPPFTDQKPTSPYAICFWDDGHATVRRFFKGIQGYLKPKGRAFIGWSSFSGVRKLKKIANEYHFNLKEVARKRGKRRFTMYMFEIKF